ncbi:MAG: hypothetical protein CMJ76_01255 [Planctomycetaceae bacterium]|nr:hypothetical protein [Planctomycetaceae bacterium]|tara:strand:- start:1232 stop:2659 length:1428 start_codon:yes stop_codon:yes gene_type:complete
MNKVYRKHAASIWSQMVVCCLLVGLCVGGYLYAKGGVAEEQVNRDFLKAPTHVVRLGDMEVSVTEQGSLESSDNVEIICRVRGQNTVTSVVESGTYVEKGDVVLTLDTLFIDEEIAERSKYAFWARSGAEHWKASVAKNQLAIPEYLEGRFVAELTGMEKDLVIAEADLLTDQELLKYVQRQYERGYESRDQVEQHRRRVEFTKLRIEVLQSDIEVFKKYTKSYELARLEGELKVSQAQFEANDERAMADASRRDRAVEEKEFCTVRAPRSGLVIHPRAAAWKNAPDITEGGTVYTEQVMLLMPNMDKMQVKVGVHEALVEHVEPGMKVFVKLPDREAFECNLTHVAEIARPPTIGVSNIVKYDVTVELPKMEGLKPGMTAEVEIVMNEYSDQVLLPVESVLEFGSGFYCWVRQGDAISRRRVELADSDEKMVRVLDGIKAGETVILNPLAYVVEAQDDALINFEQTATETVEED